MSKTATTVVLENARVAFAIARELANDCREELATPGRVLLNVSQQTKSRHRTSLDQLSQSFDLLENVFRSPPKSFEPIAKLLSGMQEIVSKAYKQLNGKGAAASYTRVLRQLENHASLGLHLIAERLPRSSQLLRDSTVDEVLASLDIKIKALNSLRIMDRRGTYDPSTQRVYEFYSRVALLDLPDDPVSPKEPENGWTLNLEIRELEKLRAFLNQQLKVISGERPPDSMEPDSWKKYTTKELMSRLGVTAQAIARWIKRRSKFIKRVRKGLYWIDDSHPHIRKHLQKKSDQEDFNQS